jgi:hypothetical protein
VDILSLQHGAIASTARRWEKMNYNEAWRAVERAALIYGVDVPAVK